MAITNSETDKFNKKLKEARRGDLVQLTSLSWQVEEYAKQTNRKMRALEKAGYDMYAYDTAKAALISLGRKRFKENWDIDYIVDNWAEFEETARQTFRFVRLRTHTTPRDMKKYSQKRLGFLVDAIGRQKTYGWSEETIQNLNKQIYSIKKAVNFEPYQYKNETDEDFAKRKKRELELIQAATPASPETVYRLEKAIASGAISTLFSQQYGITGEAFEALYNAFEDNVDYTTEIADKLYEMTSAVKSVRGKTDREYTTTGIIEYLRSLGE